MIIYILIFLSLFNFKNYYLVKRLYIITRSERFLKFCSPKIHFILIYNKYQSLKDFYQAILQEQYLVFKLGQMLFLQIEMQI